MNNIDLRNGDCLELIKTIKDKTIDLVVTDPPYLFDNGNWYSSNVDGNKSKFANSSLFSSNGKVKNNMGQFGENEISNMLEILLPKMRIPNAYFFCCEEQVPFYTMFARKKNLHYQILVWEKPLSIINKNRFSMNVEFVVRIYDFGTGLNRLSENELYNRVLHDRPVNGSNKIHPTQKSVSMYRKFILLSSNEGDVVLDPFMGSGTCGIACIKEKRKFVGMELDEEYYKKAEQRIKSEQQQLTLF